MLLYGSMMKIYWNQYKPIHVKTLDKKEHQSTIELMTFWNSLQEEAINYISKMSIIYKIINGVKIIIAKIQDDNLHFVVIGNPTM